MITESQIEKLRSETEAEIKLVKSAEELERLRVKYLGRNQGQITNLISEIPKLNLEGKKLFAPKLIELKKDIETKFEIINKSLLEEKTFGKEKILDATLKGETGKSGHLHPTLQVINEIKEIFHYFGFSWQDGPEVEFDLYNFQKLRLHKNHPARDTQQTFYLSDEVLLRTQTSAMQIRYLESHKPPVRMLFPGRVYRREQIDATHLPSFYQVEGLLVDQQTTMTDLIGILDYFAKKMFGPSTKIRVYGHHFPYTEPSIEVEVLYKNGKWLEILGAGMVHPEVLRNCGIDNKKYRGWAFGMGPERIAMIKYGIDDIRLFYSNDLYFLEQF